MININTQSIERLQKLILKLVGLFALIFVINYTISSQILSFLLQPLHRNIGQQYYQVIYTTLSEGFFVKINIAFCLSIVVFLPIVSIFIYNFCSYGMYKHEKVLTKLTLGAISMLFCLGCAFAYYYVLPMAIRFFSSFKQISSTQFIYFQPRLIEYIEFVCSIMLAFGISFQIPIGIFLLHISKLLNYKSISKLRRHLIVGIFILAAIVTPPDVMSQIVLALVLLGLIELSFIACRMYDTLKQPS